MGLFGGGNSKSETNNDSQDTQQAVTVSDNGFANNSNIKAGSGATVNVTDAGAIQGSVKVANTALQTADTITERIGEQSLNALDRVAGLAANFGKSVEGIKKTELTSGGSILLDNLKYWPIIPITVVLIAYLNRPAKSGK